MRMLYLSPLALAGAIAISIPAPAAAWGNEGHKIVAIIANHYLTPRTRYVVDQILRSDPDRLTPTDMASRATWADAYRQTHVDTAGWHFVNIDYDHPDMAAVCQSHNCVVTKIGDFEADLGSRDQAARAFALKMILHLVGDIHEPLHDINRHDSGGNCEQITAAGDQPTSLHAYWDTGVVHQLGGYNPQTVADRLLREINKQNIAAWVQGTPADWAVQSYRIAKSVAYSYSVNPSCSGPPVRLSDGYQANAQAVAGKQLERAGVRLAAVLNAYLK